MTPPMIEPRPELPFTSPLLYGRDTPTIRRSLMSFTSLATLSIGVIFVAFLGVEEAWTPLAQVSGLAFFSCLLLSVFIYASYYYLAIVLYPLTFLVCVTVGAYAVDDYSGLFYGFYCAIILMVGGLIGNRASILMTLICMVLGSGVLYQAHHENYMVSTAYPLNIWSRWVTGSAELLITAIATQFILGNLLHHQKESEKTRVELLVTNRALQQSEHTKQAIINTIPDMMALIHRSGVYLDYKPLQIFQQEDPANTVIGRTVYELLPPDLAHTRLALMRQALDSGQTIEYEERQKVREEWATFSTRLIPVEDDRVLVMMRDVTAEKQRETAELVSQKWESLRLLAGGVAHDFNNLLTGMMAQISLALRKIGPDHPAATHLQKAVTATERAADLTRQLLAYTGQGTFRLESLSLNEVILDNANFLHAGLPKLVELNLQLQNGLPLVLADRGHMQQVVMNLIINAAEATEKEDGQITISTTAYPRPAVPTYINFPDNLKPTAEHYVCLRVEDEGIGIAPENLSRIFDPFFTRKANGHGLGLAALLGIIRRYQGGIHVESVVGQGTVFTILFPAVEQTPDAFEKR